MKIKTFAVLNVIFACVLTVGLFWYMELGGLWRKGTVSACFCAWGAVNVVFALCSGVKKRAYPVWMLLGLIVAMLGDIYINKEFILGAGLFAVGHILYVCAFMSIRRAEWMEALLGGLIFLGSAALLLNDSLFFYGNALLEKVCLGYAFIISCMMGKAISCAIRKPCAASILMGLGSILFYTSDLMLALNYFSNAPNDITSVICLTTYYPGQGILAATGFFWVLKQIKDEQKAAVGALEKR